MAKKLGVWLGLVCLCWSQNEYWSYFDKGAGWGGECATGKLQSPIQLGLGELYEIPKHSNISLVFREHFKDPKVQGHFNSYTYFLTGNFGYFEAYQHGHTSDKHKINFNYMEFHAPAEHYILDIQPALELQVFGTNETSGANIAFSVLFNAHDGSSNSFIGEVIKANDKAEEIHLKKAFDSDSKIEEFYNYKGSITHPPCTENIEWFVWKHIPKITYKQLDFFKSHWEGDQEFAGGYGNARALQPENAPDYRYIFYYKGDDDDDDFAQLLGLTMMLALVFN